MKIVSSLGGLAQDARGTSVVELALLSPILLATLAGLVDCGRLVATKLTLQQAAERAVELATLSSVSSSSYTPLQTEAATAANVSTSNVTVTSWLECDGTRQTSFDGTCADGQQTARYVSVAVAGSYSPSFYWIFNSRTISLSGSASVRVQ